MKAKIPFDNVESFIKSRSFSTHSYKILYPDSNNIILNINMNTYNNIESDKLLFFKLLLLSELHNF